jgi:hypothetical protein
MAVRETLEFDLRTALRQVGELERMIEDLGRPVTLDLDVRGDAAREIRTIDERLDDIINSAQALSRELRETEGAAAGASDDFSTMATEIGTAENRASALARELIEADRAAGRLDTEVGEVAAALNRSEGQAAGLTRELNQADRAAASINTRAGAFGGIGAAITGAAAGIAAAGVGLALGVRGANAAIQSFAELEDSINAVNVVFGDAAGAVVDFGESAAQSAGLSQQAFNQAVVPIGSLLQNFGFDATEAADAAVILVQRAADLASVMGGTVQDALLAVGAALRGEADPLERYGASISAARVEQFALAEGLAATKGEITDAVKLQARYGLILQDTARVQNDFANTAGDLANAQRIAAAEAANFGADIGEVLAPAMSALVGLLPEVLDGLRQLVPGFANAADSAGAFFDSIEQGSGVRAPFQAVAAGLGLVGDALAGFTDIGSGIFDALTLNFEGVGEQMDQFADRFARATKRIIGQNLARELDKGTNSAVAFVNSLSAFGREEENLRVFADSYQTFAIQAGLSSDELREATRFMIENAEQAGLSADEIQFLTEQYALLSDAVFPSIEAVREFNRVQRENADLPPVFADTTQFTTFTSELAKLPAEMRSTALDVRRAANVVAEALNPFDEPPERIALSARQFFQNLTEEINREAEFQAGIVQLILREQFNLARLLGDQGPAAQDTLEQFLANLDLAEAANTALLTGETELSKDISEWLTRAIANASTPEIRTALTSLIVDKVITSGPLQNAIVTGTASAASRTVSSYREALIEEGEQLEMDRIARIIGERVEESFTADDQAEYAAGQTVAAWEEEAIRAARDLSPAELQAALGDLFSGVIFNIDASQFNFPDSGAFQGTIGSGAVLTPTVTTTTPPSVVIYQNFTGEIRDLDTQLAQAAQSTAAAGTLLNRVVAT